MKKTSEGQFKDRTTGWKPGYFRKQTAKTHYQGKNPKRGTRNKEKSKGQKGARGTKSKYSQKESILR